MTFEMDRRPDGAPAQTEVSARRPSVVWVLPGPLRQPTGGYLYDARVAEGLAARGWDVAVLDLGVRRWPLDAIAAGRLVHALDDDAWDAVVFDELAHPAMALGVPWLRIAKACPSAALVGLVHHLRASEPSPPVPRWAARRVERAALAGLDRIVCTSRSTAETVRALLGRGDLPDVVPPGVDTHALERTAPESPTPDPSSSGVVSEPPDRPSEAAGTLRVLLVSHWTPRKDVLTALRALALAPAGVTLDLVGDGDRDPEYGRRVTAALAHPALTGRVRVHGVVSAEDLAGLYARADAFLLTSTHEGYGMVLAEALRAGLPIVATRAGAIPDVVGDGAGAELVAPRDARSIARILRSLADDPDERARRAALASARGLLLPTWRASIASFDTILREAIASGAARS